MVKRLDIQVVAEAGVDSYDNHKARAWITDRLYDAVSTIEGIDPDSVRVTLEQMDPE